MIPLQGVIGIKYCRLIALTNGRPEASFRILHSPNRAALYWM